MAKIKTSVGKAVDATGFPLEEVVAASKSRTTRIFRGFWGKSFGKVLAGRAAPHKGATIGVADFDEKIKILTGYNARLGARCEAFGKEMMGHRGEKGIVLARSRGGELMLVSMPAFNISKKLTKMSQFASGDAVRSYLKANPSVLKELKVAM